MQLFLNNNNFFEKNEMDYTQQKKKKNVSSEAEMYSLFCPFILSIIA